MAFRDPAATLRHEQVEPQMVQLVERLKHELKAELRT
jgi:phenylalanyl-tRNA synthetase beta subunit